MRFLGTIKTDIVSLNVSLSKKSFYFFSDVDKNFSDIEKSW